MFLAHPDFVFCQGTSSIMLHTLLSVTAINEILFIGGCHSSTFADVVIPLPPRKNI